MLLLASLPNKGVYQEFDGKRYLPDFHLYGLGRMMPLRVSVPRGALLLGTSVPFMESIMSKLM